MTRTRATVIALFVFATAYGCQRDADVGSQSVSAATTDSEVQTMRVGIHEGSKVQAPVDVRYGLAGVAVKDQPTRLDIVVTPQIEGTNLEITPIPSDSVSVDAAGAGVIADKARATTEYRKQLLVTPLSSDAGDVRLMVSIDVAGGRYASVVRLPLGPDPASALQEKGK